MGCGYGRVDYESSLTNPKALARFYGEKIFVQGEVITIPRTQSHHLRFDMQVSTIQGRESKTKLRLNWYGPRPHLFAGSKWQFQVKLHQVTKNKTGFDYVRYLHSQGISAVGYVIQNAGNKKLVSAGQHTTINTIRQRIAFVIKHAVYDRSLAGILTALTVGSRFLLGPDEWQVFQATGTSHLIAVSGLHVGLSASCLYVLLNWLWRRVPRLCVLVPAQRVATIGALLAAMGYVLFAGLSTPTIRALIMLSALFCGTLSFKNIPMWYRYLLAWVGVLLLYPFALLSVSFWLSFLATAILGFCVCARIIYRGGLVQWVRLQFLIFIGLVPPTLIFFGKLSLVSLLTNLFAIPYVSFVVLPFSLLSMAGYFISPGIDNVLWVISAKMLMPLWWGLKWFAHLPHALWYHPLTKVWECTFLSIAVVLCLLPAKFPGRGLAAIFGLVLFFA